MKTKIKTLPRIVNIVRKTAFMLFALLAFFGPQQVYALNQMLNWGFTGNANSWTTVTDNGNNVCGNDSRSTGDAAFNTSAYSSNNYVMTLTTDTDNTAQRNYIHQQFTVPGTGNQKVRGGFTFVAGSGSYNASGNTSWTRIDVYNSANDTFVGTLGCKSFNSAQSSATVGMDRELTLTGGTTYTFVITGRHQSGTSNTNTSFTFDNVILTTSPVGVSATPADGSSNISLSWTASAAASGANGLHASTPYKVYRGASSGSETFLANATTNSYTDSTAVAGSTYYYWVTNMDTASVESASSTEVSATANYSYVSGTVYSSEGGSNIGSGKTITAYKNGSTLLDSGTTDSNGAYSLAGTENISSGDVITVYIDGNGTKGNTVLISDGTLKSDVHIYGSALAARHDSGANITNANLATGYVSGDSSDMVYSVSGSDLTLSSNTELHVWTGDTYAPGGSVTTQGTGDIHVDDNAVVTFGSGSVTIADDLNVDAGATVNINVDTSVADDIVTAGTATLTTTGGTPTITLSGSATLGGGSNALTFYNLVGSGSGTMTVNSTTTVTNSMIAGEKTWNITVSYEPFDIRRAFNADTSTVSYQGSGHSTVTPLTYYNLEVVPSSGSPTYKLGTTTAQTLTVGNNFLIGGIGNVTVDVNTRDPVLDINGSLSIGSGDTLSASASANLIIGANLTNNGAFVSNNGVVTFDGTGASVITSPANMTFYDFVVITPGKALQFEVHGGDNIPTFTISGTMTITGQVGNPIYVRSNIPTSQWLVSFSQSQSLVTYAVIHDSACAVGSFSVAYSITNGGSNNGSCWNIANQGSDGTGQVTSVEQGSGGGNLQTGGARGGGGGGSGGDGESGGGQGQTGGGQGGGGGGTTP